MHFLVFIEHAFQVTVKKTILLYICMLNNFQMTFSCGVPVTSWTSFLPTFWSQAISYQTSITFVFPDFQQFLFCLFCSFKFLLFFAFLLCHCIIFSFSLYVLFSLFSYLSPLASFFLSLILYFSLIFSFSFCLSNSLNQLILDIHNPLLCCLLSIQLLAFDHQKEWLE